MLDLLRSLSLESGAAVIVLLSGLCALALGRIRPTVYRWLALVAAPLVLAFSLYWLPVWLGANASEYSSWAGLFIGPWFLLGAIFSVFVGHVVAKLRSGNGERNG